MPITDMVNYCATEYGHGGLVRPGTEDAFHYTSKVSVSFSICPDLCFTRTCRRHHRANISVILRSATLCSLQARSADVQRLVSAPPLSHGPVNRRRIVDLYNHP
ncbi:hypothetical protein C8Q74DRAFT_1257782 [Fomes fomentarius]|nr:hypothetical protein C8Q74DRAFT_1257782 [Fomes fomentarius]